MAFWAKPRDRCGSRSDTNSPAASDPAGRRCSSQGDVVIVPHKAFDAFQGTDLDTQLRQRNIDHIIIAGMVTNTCVDSTGRSAYEKGYHVTHIADAVGAFSMAAHKATIELNWPRYAHEVLTAEELVASLAKSTR